MKCKVDIFSDLKGKSFCVEMKKITNEQILRNNLAKLNLFKNQTEIF